jgi:multiple sugar transport system ATP-binding protein
MTDLELRGLDKRYGRQYALNDVSMHVADHEFVACVGPTGCGKTTLLRVVGGLEPMSGGDMFMDGQNINRVPTRDRRVAMVSQEYALYPHLKVFDNIEFPLRALKKVPARERERKVKEVAERLDLTPLLDQRPSALAGGERQRVALARAIVRDAQLLLFDEPLSNVDAHLRPGLLRELTHLHRDLGITTLYVTHDQMDALRLADRVAVFDEGVLQQIGTARELLDEPVNMFVAGFLGLPPMSFVPARLVGQVVQLPFALVRLPEERTDRLPFEGTFVAGVRPVYADDSMVLDPADDDLVEVGRSGTGVPAEMLDFERDLAGLSIRSSVPAVGTELVAALKAEGLMPPGRADRIYVDTRKMHLFDPATGENLTMLPRPA